MIELLSAPAHTIEDHPKAAGCLRADLFVPAEGSREAFNFGVWVSLEAEEMVKYLAGADLPLRGWVAGAGAMLSARILPQPQGGAPAVELVDGASSRALAALLHAI